MGKQHSKFRLHTAPVDSDLHHSLNLGGAS